MGANVKKRRLNGFELLSGQRFGALTYLREVESKILPCGQKNRIVMCKCDCGNEKNIRLSHLVNGKINSCGCLSGEKHGDSYAALYMTYKSMIVRCHKQSKFSHRYRDRGISVCEEWINAYGAFKEWALKNGYKHGLDIDRIDNNGNYCPENCRWTTRKINANNREMTLMVVYRGERISLKLLLERLKLDQMYHTIYRRIKRGWDDTKAIETPAREGNYHNRWKDTALQVDTRRTDSDF